MSNSDRGKKKSPGQSEDIFRLLFDSTADALFLHNLEGRFLEVNQAGCDSLGYTREELLQLPFSAIVKDWEPEALGVLWARVLEGEKLTVQGLQQRRDGSTFAVEVHLSPFEYEGRPHILASARDITERLAAEKALQDSVEKYRRLQANIPGMVYMYALHPDGSFSFPYANAFSRELFDVAPEDIMRDGNLLAGLIHPDDKERRDRAIKHSAETLQPFREELRHIVKGEVRWYDCLSRPEPQPNGDILWDGIMLEITDRKRVEEALRTSESFLNSIIELSPYPMWMSDAQGTLLRLNQACRDLLHINPEEVVGKYNVLKDNIIEEQGFLPLLQRVFEKGETIRFEITYDTSRLKTLPLKTSAAVILDVTVSPIKDGSGKITHAVFQHVDITHRKRAEAALAESEQRFSTFMDHLPAAAFIKDQEGRLLFANRYLRETFGWEDCLGKTTAELLPPEMARQMIEDDRQVLAAGAKVIHETITDIQGGEHFFDTYKFPIMAEGSPVLLGGIAVDITDRKRSEEALQKEKLLTEAILDSLPCTFFLLNSQGQQLRTNRSEIELTGYSLEELTSMHALESIAEEDKQAAQCAMEEVLEKGEASLEAQMLTKDGRKIPFFFSAKKFIIDSLPYILGTGLDITARKQAEEALQKEKLLTEAILDSLPSTFFLLDSQGQQLRTNRFGLAVTRYTPEEISRLHALDSIAEEDRASAQRALEEVMEKGEASLEAQMLTKDGRKIPFLFTARKFMINDLPHILGTGMDITERTQAEEALRESEERYRSLFHNNHAVMFLINPENGAIMDANPAACDFYGFSQEELLTKTTTDLNTLPPDQVFRAMQKAKAEKQKSFQFQHRLASGEVRDVEVFSGPIRIKRQDLLYSIVHDVTARKKAEEALRESEKRLKEAQELAHLGFWYWNVKTGDVTWSEEVYKIFQLDAKEFTPRIDSIIELSPWSGDRERDQDLIRKAMESHEKGAYEQRFLRPDKSIGYYYSTFQGKYDEDGNLLTIVGTVLDITERKKTEEALRESETKYRHLYQDFQGILDTIPDTVCLLSPDLTILWANQAPAIRQDMPNISEIGKHCYSQRHGRPEPCEDCPVLRCFKSGKMETEIHGAHGKFWELRAFPIYDDQGELRGGLEVARDITESKRMEEALRESQALYQDLVETAQDLIWQCDSEGRYTYLNPAWEEVFGYKIEEMLGKHFANFQPPEYAARDQQEHYRLLKGNIVKGLETVHLAKDGRELHLVFNAKVVRDNGGQVTGTRGTAYNISDRKLAEEALRLSEKKYRSLYQEFQGILDTIPDTVCLLSPDLTIMWANQVDYSDVISSNISEIGKHCYPQRHGRSEPCENCPVLRCFSSGKMEIAVHPAHGRIWELRAFPIYDDQGEVRGGLEVARDITESKRAEEEQTKLKEQMQEVQKLESLGVLAGGIAHDFNNLLLAILGNADLAMLSLSPASPAFPYVEEITKASLRAADLCRQMLAYSGKGRFVVGHYDLSELVREMAQILKVSVSKDATLRYNFAADLPAVEVDATQMRQVIMNLITNASEALGNQSGIISVSTGVIDCNRAYLVDSYLDDKLPEGRYVYLEVADTGGGMDEETQRRIFDPFFTTKFTGRGLGLAAVLGIVRGHQGAIKVYSEVGQGSTFKVLLPAKEWALGEREPRLAQIVQPFPGGGTILLVDDDPEVRGVGTQMLERLGFKVLTAAHGRDGLKIFQECGSEIDCVILDLTMPEMGGEEVFRELHRLRRDVRVILSSGYNEQDVTQKFAGKGLAGFIQKPYRVANLREVLSRVFR
jgi:two-component system cell cycle sensor histidine kinase/response regulator CckA